MTHHRALGCGCGCSGAGRCGTRSLGALGAFPEPAGEINGIGTLLYDVQQLTTDLAQRWGNTPIRFDRGAYHSMLQRARRQQLTRMTATDIRQLVSGVVGDVAGAVIKARQLAQLPVNTDQERAANHARQAAVIGPARLMWDATGEMFRYATVQQTGASGLGWPPLAIAAVIAVVIVLVAVAAITAATYLADSQARLIEARAEAERVCRRSGGCTPEQYARIRRELAIGPFDGAIQAAGEGIGEATTVVLVAGGAVIAGVAVWGGWRIWKARRALG